jgi:alkyl hydroperoxide reductase subunit AhpC
VTLQYPIIADENKEVANLFDMIHPNADDTTVRSVFIIELIRK